MGLSLHPFSDVPIEHWMTLLNHPDVVRHMPLADANWNEEAVAAWIRGKDSQWIENGYGPLAIRIDHDFAGWGGFQQEDGEADFALVLFPGYWGRGGQIFHHFMSHRMELGIETVSILLPPSRLRTRGLRRLGFEYVGDVEHGEQRFLKFQTTGQRLKTVCSAGLARPIPPRGQTVDPHTPAADHPRSSSNPWHASTATKLGEHQDNPRGAAD
jgi:hypothetical protein